MLQCDAVCCIVMQCDAVSCSVLQCESTLYKAAVHDFDPCIEASCFTGVRVRVRVRVCVLQCVAVCCSVLQRVAG